MSPTRRSHPNLTQDQLSDIHLATSKMHGAERRAFQAEMTLKYCNGSARNAETHFGWNRKTVMLGLAEKRSGLVCVGAQASFSGTKRWEINYPQAAQTLQEIAESHSQQDPTFKSSIAYTRLTAAAAIEELRKRGVSPDQLPAPSTMAAILNRMGYRLRQVVKAKPQKKFQKPTQSLTISEQKTSRMRLAE